MRDAKKTNRNNRRRGKEYERRSALIVDGVRNLDKSRPHTDVENDTHVFEIKSSQAKVPTRLNHAMEQVVLASGESKKDIGGVIWVYTKGARARYFLIQEITDGMPELPIKE